MSNIMKIMESQNVKIDGNIIVTDVMSVRDYKGAPHGTKVSNIS